MAFEIFACPLFQCLVRHGSQSASTAASMAMATPPTISTVSSVAGVLHLTHVKWNLVDSLFVGPLWILFLCRSPDGASLQTYSL